MNQPRNFTDSSVTLPPIDVIYEDPDTQEVMAMRVKTTIKDRAAYEVHAAKNGWPTEKPMINAMFLWSSFLAWSATRREANAPAHLKTSTPDAFVDLILDVQPVDEEAKATHIDPSQGEAAPELD